MKTFWLALGLVLCASASAQPQASCEAVLRPNLEISTSNYQVMQAYMYVNAASEYDRLRKLDSNSRSADASYKFFSAEYEDSTTSSTFQDAVRKRLQVEGFRMQTSGATSVYRETVSDSQVAAWAGCMNNGSGNVLASASAIDYQSKSFVLTVYWVPQTGVGEGMLSISVVNGKIGKTANVTERRLGRGGKSYSVTADAEARSVSVIANIANSTDNLSVSLAPPKPAPTPSPGAVLQSGSFDVAENQACNPGDSDSLNCFFGGGAIKPKSANSFIAVTASVQTDITAVTQATGGCTNNLQTTDPWRRGELMLYCGDSKKRSSTEWSTQTAHLSVLSQSYDLKARCEPNGQPVQVSVLANPRGCSVMTSKMPSLIRWTEVQK